MSVPSRVRSSAKQLLKSPSRLPIPAAVLALMLNVLVLGLGLQRMRAADIIAAQVVVLEENLVYAQQIDTTEIERLQSELELAQNRLVELQRDLSGSGAAFDPVSEVSRRAAESGLEIVGMETEELSSEDTAYGTVTVATYSFQALCDLASYVRFIATLETSAPEAVSLDGLQVASEDRQCSFAVIVVGGLGAVSE